jgi:uncharacterized LabA/DUF88 family protein
MPPHSRRAKVPQIGGGFRSLCPGRFGRLFARPRRLYYGRALRRSRVKGLTSPSLHRKGGQSQKEPRDGGALSFGALRSARYDGPLVPRVTVFIDGSNLYHGGKRAGLRVDIEKLRDRLVGERELVRAYYYIATVPQQMSEENARNQQRFLDHLNRVPYLDVRLGRLEKRPHGWEEKGVDTRLVTDMVHMAAKNQYDIAILVSGDGDLAHTAQAVKDLGKHVENAYFALGRSRHLIQACDRFIELTPDYLDGCLLPDAEEEPVVLPDASIAEITAKSIKDHTSS